MDKVVALNALIVTLVGLALVILALVLEPRPLWTSLGLGALTVIGGLVGMWLAGWRP